MTLAEIASLAEIAAASAVVLSLVYVGAQLKQHAAATKLAAAQSFASADNDFVGLINASSELPEVLHKAANGLDGLSSPDTIRFMAFIDQVVISIHAAHTQYEAGSLDQRLWRVFRCALEDMMVQAGQREWWARRRHWFDEDFQALVDELIEGPGGRPMHPRSVSP